MKNVCSAIGRFGSPLDHVERSIDNTCGLTRLVIGGQYYSPISLTVTHEHLDVMSDIHDHLKQKYQMRRNTKNKRIRKVKGPGPWSCVRLDLRTAMSVKLEDAVHPGRVMDAAISFGLMHRSVRASLFPIRILSEKYPHEAPQ